MIDIRIPARLEAIAKLAKLTDSGFSLENGEIVRWTKGDKPTDEEIQSQMDSDAYARARAESFPSWQDQLDMQYHDSVDGTTTWKDAIAKVKSDNPKTE